MKFRAAPKSRMSSKSNLFNTKVAKKAIPPADASLILKMALAGNLENGPISTEETGQAVADFKEASKAMTDLIKEIQPDALDNVQFLQKAKKEADIKKKIIKKIEEDMNNQKDPKKKIDFQKSMTRSLSKFGNKKPAMNKVATKESVGSKKSKNNVKE